MALMMSEKPEIQIYSKSDQGDIAATTI